MKKSLAEHRALKKHRMKSLTIKLKKYTKHKSSLKQGETSPNLKLASKMVAIKSEAKAVTHQNVKKYAVTWKLLILAPCPFKTTSYISANFKALSASIAVRRWQLWVRKRRNSRKANNLTKSVSWTQVPEPIMKINRGSLRAARVRARTKRFRI